MRQLLERSATAVAFTTQCTAYLTRCSEALIRLHAAIAFLLVARFQDSRCCQAAACCTCFLAAPTAQPCFGLSCLAYSTTPVPALVCPVKLPCYRVPDCPKICSIYAMTASSTQNWQTVKDSALPMSAARVPQHCLHVSNVLKVTCDLYKAPD